MFWLRAATPKVRTIQPIRRQISHARSTNSKCLLSNLLCQVRTDRQALGLNRGSSYRLWLLTSAIRPVHCRQQSRYELMNDVSYAISLTRPRSGIILYPRYCNRGTSSTRTKGGQHARHLSLITTTIYGQLRTSSLPLHQALRRPPASKQLKLNTRLGS